MPRPLAPRTGAPLLLMSLLLASVACDDPTAVEETVPVATVAVAPQTRTLTVGESTTLAATPRAANGAALAGRAVAWSTEDAAVATVTNAGTVLATSAGTTRVRALVEGKSGYATVVVTAPPPPPVVASVTLDATSIFLDEGETRQLVATARDAQGATIEGRTVTWSVAGAAPVATVSATGLVTAVAMGTATVTAVVDGQSAQAAVTVLGTSAFDLLLDHWSTGTGLVAPSVARLDLRTPDAAPSSLFQLAHTADAAPSPDGTRIAFTCSGTAICVADADGRNVAVLTNGALLADQPAWSPDGARIAFRGWAPGGPAGPFNPSRIWVMNADGSGKSSLTDGAAGWQESPTWSPAQPDGGYRIAYAQWSQPGEYAVAHVASMRADGSDVRAVTAAGAWTDDQPAWSPDGQTIAFVRTGGEAQGDVWLVGADGADARPLMAADPAGAQRAPAWSPDGTMIAFSSNHDIQGNFYTWQIFTVRADGTQLQRRTHEQGEKHNPAWIRRTP